jgi:hypothetical protein
MRPEVCFDAPMLRYILLHHVSPYSKFRSVSEVFLPKTTRRSSSFVQDQKTTFQTKLGNDSPAGDLLLPGRRSLPCFGRALGTAIRRFTTTKLEQK